MKINLLVTLILSIVTSAAYAEKTVCSSADGSVKLTSKNTEKELALDNGTVRATIKGKRAMIYSSEIAYSFNHSPVTVYYVTVAPLIIEDANAPLPVPTDYAVLCTVQ